MPLEETRLAPGRRVRERILPAGLVAVSLAAAGVVAVVWRPVAPSDLAVATDLDRFATDVLATVDAYRRPRYAAGLASLTLTVAVPLWAVATRRGRRLVSRLAGGASASPLRGAAVAAAIAAGVAIARFPIRLWATYFHERSWGFRTSGLGRWLADWGIDAGVTILVAGGAGAVLVAAMRRWPRSWHLRLVPLGVAAAAALLLAHPILIQPLLLRTSPLPPGPTRDAVETVLARAGEDDLEVLVGDASRRTTRVNAFVTGLGPSRQLVLYDTLLDLEDDQVAAIVAHELAHREHADLLRGVLATGAVLLPGLVLLRRILTAPGTHQVLGARAAVDTRLVAVAALVVALGALIGQPLSNALSRRVEAAADHRALELSGAPVPLVRAARTFVVRDLAEPDPPAWVRALWGTHPSPRERVRAAAGYAEQTGIDLPDLDEVQAAERSLRHPRIGAR